MLEISRNGSPANDSKTQLDCDNLDYLAVMFRIAETTTRNPNNSSGK